MVVSTDKTLKLWAKLAPVGYKRPADFQNLSASELREVLEGWVAWLHSVEHTDELVRAFQQQLTQLLEDFDTDQKGTLNAAELERRLSNWLETAGEVGGPEQEQDPVGPHPALWHSNLERSKGEA